MRLEYQRPPVRVAVIGLGRSFFSSHYPVFKAHPALFKIVAVCDLLKERRDIVAKDFPDCKMFRQFGDMLDEREIERLGVHLITAPVADVRNGYVRHHPHMLAREIMRIFREQSPTRIYR